MVVVVMGGCCSRDKASRRSMSDLEDDEEEEEEVKEIHAGDWGAIVRLKGSCNMASMCTQQGRKGVNQDAMTIWEVCLCLCLCICNPYFTYSTSCFWLDLESTTSKLSPHDNFN